MSREERLPAILLTIFFVALCVAGGASREDVLGQVVIRTVAIIVILVQIVAGRLPRLGRYRTCSLLLGAMIALSAVQLIPLPPAIWTALPGRALIASSPLGAANWRPLNMVPDAGWNSLFSLLVPLSVLVLLSSLETRTVRRARYLVMGAVSFSALVALLQAVGAAPDNPIINGSTIDYAGVFANRNHQALFLSVGILVAWFWGFRHGNDIRERRLWLALCIIALFSISILVTGSRTGAIVGILAVVTGPLFAQSGHRDGVRGGRSRFFWPGVSLALAVGVIVLSLYFGRAVSVDRAASLGLQTDFRLRAWPTVWRVAGTYFPFGAGMGTFDQVFRIAEPFGLLEPTYFNHAHNDFLETVIETGIFGPIILLSSLIWFVRRIMALPTQSRENARMARLGALIIALTLIASLSDYAARTPMTMALLVIAGCWLTGAPPDSGIERSDGALPATGKYL